MWYSMKVSVPAVSGTYILLTTRGIVLDRWNASSRCWAHWPLSKVFRWQTLPRSGWKSPTKQPSQMGCYALVSADKIRTFTPFDLETGFWTGQEWHWSGSPLRKEMKMVWHPLTTQLKVQRERNKRSH